MDTRLGRLLAWPILGVVIGMAACGGSDPSPEPTTPPTTSVTWNKGISVLVRNNCGSCHYPGGSGHFDLLNYESAKALAPSALAAMQSGRMPPWPPSSDCLEYMGDRTLLPAVVDKFSEWVAGGMPAGDGEVKTFTPPMIDKLREDMTAKMTEAYTPNPSLVDDYRCFVVDLDFATDTWVKGST